MVDAGNNRIVKLNINIVGMSLSWNKSLTYYNAPSITDLECDALGHIWASTSFGTIARFSENLEILDEIPMGGTAVNQLNNPSCLSVAGGAWGRGGMMISELWTEETGIKGFTIGTAIKDLFVDGFVNGSVCNARIYFRVTDRSVFRVRILTSTSSAVKTVTGSWPDGPAQAAGAKMFVWDGRNSAGQLMPQGSYKAEVLARSTYWNPYTSQWSAVVGDTVEFTHCGDTCTWLVGDADGNGSLTASDMVHIINYIFAGGPAPVPHPIGSGDADCSATVTISDATYLMNFIFFGGGPPPQCDCSNYR